MPNWTSNTLTVTGTGKYKKELAEFIKAVDGTDLIIKKDLKNAKKKYLDENRQKYIDEKNLVDWANHNNLTPLKFFLEVLYYGKNKDGSVYKGSKMSMAKLFPMPAELLKYTSPSRAEHGENKKQFEERVARCKKMYGADDWYHWNCNKYGTKWDVDASIVSQTPTQIIYQFDSAWSPPTAFIQSASNKIPNLHFSMEYEGEGGEYAGITEATGGDFSDQETEPKTKYCGHCGNQLDDDGNCTECQ